MAVQIFTIVQEIDQSVTTVKFTVITKIEQPVNAVRIIRTNA